jgi:hypothetical protein
MDDRYVSGLKGFPGCKECQCYPEGRVDCPDHLKCREWLAENDRRYRARREALNKASPNAHIDDKEFLAIVHDIVNDNLLASP